MVPKISFKTSFSSIMNLSWFVSFLKPFQEVQKRSSLLNLQKWFKEIWGSVLQFWNMKVLLKGQFQNHFFLGMYRNNWSVVLNIINWDPFYSGKNWKNTFMSYKKYSVCQKMVHVEMGHFDQQNFIISTAWFYMIFKITKLALKYRLFHQICFCHSRDMFDLHLKSTLCHFQRMKASKRQTMQVLHTWVISLRIKRKVNSWNTITWNNIL